MSYSQNRSKDLDNYAILMYIGAEEYGGKQEYWITMGGHAHSQALSGCQPGALGRKHGNQFRCARD